MSRSLKLEELRYHGVRYTVDFYEVKKGVVLFTVTGHYNKGYKPKIINSGKAKTKKQAMNWATTAIMNEGDKHGNI